VAVGQPRQHVESRTRDGPGALDRDAGLAEGLLGQSLVLGLDVDGGEHAIGPHAAQQPEPRHPGAGADLDDGSGVDDGGEEPQRGPGTGADRHHADLLGPGAGDGEQLVLGHELFGVGPARGLDRGGNDGLLGGTTHRCGDPTACAPRVAAAETGTVGVADSLCR
jgi:hypothetical protein